MHNKQRSKKRNGRQVPRHVTAIFTALLFVVPAFVTGADAFDAYDQSFVITAYYSPLPDQCCYVRGGYDADRVLNGNGVAGADGTAVYPGMIAAPSTYAFGTRIKLPMGTFEVHDRGGAISELSNGSHRLDIWMGFGEEGLARALAFGVQKVRGRVYPSGGPAVSFDFAKVPQGTERLAAFWVESPELLDVHPKANDVSYSVRLLQESLAETGHFTHPVTGKFGQVTQNSLQKFNAAMGLAEPSDHLTERSAAFLAGAVARRTAPDPIPGQVNRRTRGDTVTAAERTLRFLGYYKGRTDGKFSAALEDAIFRFQKDHKLVTTRQDPGAGRIGPLTLGAIRTDWNKRLVEGIAMRLIAMHRIDTIVAARGDELKQFLSTGDHGSQVRVLQRMLARKGYFPKKEINGSFGAMTKASLAKYQVANHLVKSLNDKGAGVLGPQTLMYMKSQVRQDMFRVVQSKGWASL